ncbi:MAG TPA: thiamine phosphate synthase [Candidatus Eisenbacteria bacterium]|nr:thiamine phosphate synthase [Candidatus Eisenbacteria bacterium]
MGTFDRILDAAFNRAREALRVLEDVYRFGRDDRAAQRRLKRLRHRLSALERPRALRLLAARDASRDVGRGDDLSSRSGLGDVAAANFKRLEEALRSVEETGGELRSGASALRFETYEAERQFLPPLLRASRLDPVRLYVLLDPNLTSRPLARVARDAFRGGAEMVQLRMKGRPKNEVRKTASEVARVARGEGGLWIANDRFVEGADGVHLGLDDGTIQEARRAMAPEGLVGATTHSIAEARRARAADYVSCGPIFATPLKPNLAPRGLSYWKSAVALGLPVFAIGGITAKRLPSLVRKGVDRIAVGAAVTSQSNVMSAARELRRLLPT